MYSHIYGNKDLQFTKLQMKSIELKNKMKIKH